MRKILTKQCREFTRDTRRKILLFEVLQYKILDTTYNCTEIQSEIRLLVDISRQLKESCIEFSNIRFKTIIYYKGTKNNLQIFVIFKHFVKIRTLMLVLY